jgi:uncharacterized membrane protein
MPIHSDAFFYISAVLLGVVAGMRSMMAPAILALTLARRPELAPASAPASWLAMRPVAIVLGLMALGELVADKLPRTPNRTALGPFLARMITGGFTGAAFMQVGQRNVWIGVACGVIGAILGTFGGFHARRNADRITGMRDPYIGALEDVIAIAIAGTVMAMLVP